MRTKFYLIISVIVLSVTGKVSSKETLISKNFNVCINAEPDVKFNINNGVDAANGEVYGRTGKLAIYVGRHPDIHGIALPTPEDVHSIRLRSEGVSEGSYISVYSYSSAVSGFSYPVYDEVFIVLRSGLGKKDIKFSRKIGASLIKCQV